MSRSTLTSFGGFNQGVAIRNVPILGIHGGQVLWVSSRNGRSGAAGTWDQPLDTIAHAHDHVNSGQADKIMVKPGHTETISAASAIALSKDNVEVIGMGIGRSRPTITFDTGATTSIAISGSGVLFHNIRLSANFADITAAIVVSGKGAILDSLAFVDTAVNMNWLTPVKVTATTTGVADGLEITNCRWRSPDAAGLQLLNSAATLDSVVVSGNVSMHEGTDSAMVKFATGKLFTYFEMMWNFNLTKQTANELLVNNDGSTNTGVIAHNRVGHADVTGTHDLGIDALGCRLFDNLSVSTDALSGLILPAIDVNL